MTTMLAAHVAQRSSRSSRHPAVRDSHSTGVRESGAAARPISSSSRSMIDMLCRSIYIYIDDDATDDDVNARAASVDRLLIIDDAPTRGDADDEISSSRVNLLVRRRLTSRRPAPRSHGSATTTLTHSDSHSASARALVGRLGDKPAGHLHVPRLLRAAQPAERAAAGRGGLDLGHVVHLGHAPAGELGRVRD